MTDTNMINLNISVISSKRKFWLLITWSSGVPSLADDIKKDRKKFGAGSLDERANLTG